LYKAGYGTAAFGNPGGWITIQDFSTSNTAVFSFPAPDNYVVVIQGINDLSSGFSAGDPQGGITIKVQEAIQITSTAFQQGGAVPVKYSCDGDNVSPPLAWSGIPEGAQSIALICDDPDAPGMIWVHWVLFNLPPDTGELSENVPDQETLSNGARHGINDSANLGYNGPCPPPGTHRYYFKIYALDTMLNLQAGATKTQLLNAMSGHILAEGELMGTYARQ
jgi:Raf kinase inhibitor-like YbhB/YbcL family protein